MRIVLCLAAFLSLFLAQPVEGLAADTLTNIRRAPAATTPGGRALVPGTVVRLPDGRQTRIIEVLPEGIRTDLGVTLTPEGTVQGAAESTPVTVVEEAVTPAAPEAAPASPETPLAVPETATPESAQTPLTPERQKAEAAPATPEIVLPDAQAPSSPQIEPVMPGASEAAPHQLTIVELLPMTPAPEQAKKEDVKEQPASKPEEKKAPVKEEKAGKPKAEKPKQEKPKEQPKPKESKKKPAIGEELRIPPEAAATGNLDFLEGCWQGTRPEYYSNRINK